ncbi:MAG: camp-dependent protein kinase 2 [Benjaminiella poitrasii]|nr:MAG: camp-dependent protein kinase 2 [Benjaminiella poitrasii]
MSFINKFIDKAKNSCQQNRPENHPASSHKEVTQKNNNTLACFVSTTSSPSFAVSSLRSETSVMTKNSSSQPSQHDDRNEKDKDVEGLIESLQLLKKETSSSELSSTMTTIENISGLEDTNESSVIQPDACHYRKRSTAYNDQAIIKQRQDRPRLKLSDFNVLRTLGTGSFGRVHLIQSHVNRRYYAIKVLKKSEVVRMKQVEHTNNEKHILESVAHPFLVNMWGTFQDTVNLYMVMDYVPGGELFSILRRSKRFPDHVAKFYAAEVILAIEYLHSKNVIYRDLKPENLLLDNQGHIKITDFGFAKHVPDITWTLCGTPDYLAPEIIQSKGYGQAVDWWSLGVLVFEMLAGYPPFYDDDHLKLYEKILAGRIKFPQYFIPNSKDLLKHLLTADLTKRYGNLKDGSEDIKRHPWFQGVDFNRVLARQIRPPYVPNIRGDGDASHFDRYPETDEEYGVDCSPDPFRHLFPDF